MPDKFYLRDEKTGEKISLEILGERLTILVKERGTRGIERTVSEVKKMIPDAGVKKISSRVYEIEYTNPVSPPKINETIDRIRREMPSVIPYNVYQMKGHLGVIYLTDEIIVTFSSGVTVDVIGSLAEKYKLDKVKVYEDDQMIYVFAQRPGNWENPIELANKIENENEKVVEIAEPNLVNRLAIAATTVARPADNFFRKQWQLETNNQDGVSPSADINAREAWNRLDGGGDPDVVIAVIDFGFDLTHPDLVNKLVNINLDPFDFVDRGDGNPKFPKPGDSDEDHGTACAGIAVAEKNGNGVVGIAYGCSLLPVCCPFQPETTDLLDIFHAIRDKADVISCSYAPEVTTDALSRTKFNMIKRIATSQGRQGQGCVICFAAGNGNLPLNEDVTNYMFFIDGVKNGPITETILNPFASHEDVIAVSASTAKNKKALYSNWGEEVWVCAPSNDMKDDGKIIGPSITTTACVGNMGNSLYTDEFGGTSSAAPLVAGVAALVISANPGLTAIQVKEILKETADKINPDDDTLGKYDNQGHSKWYGFGKVNAGKAVKRALDMLSDE